MPGLPAPSDTSKNFSFGRFKYIFFLRVPLWLKISGGKKILPGTNFLDIYEKLENREGIASVFNSMGRTYQIVGDFSSSLENYLKSRGNF